MNDLTVEELVALISINMVGLNSDLTNLVPEEALVRVGKVKEYAALLEEKIQQAAEAWDEIT